MASRGHCCGCFPGHLNEDNSRFLLLTVLLMLYLLGGAAVFCALERAPERLAQHNWSRRLTNFSRHYNVSVDELKNFLRLYEQATMAGIHVDSVRQRWDLMGAFYFVATVVTTIGERADLYFSAGGHRPSLPPTHQPTHPPTCCRAQRVAVGRATGAHA